jgi:tetratricopeptide (TPR) repeat protein
MQTWLREGIAAAKAGQMAEAQTALARVVAADPTNIPAWLWLSGAMSDANARVACLAQALDHNPEQPQLQQALEMARTQQLQVWMHEALQAEVASDRPRARELLLQVVAADEVNVAAWWELGQLVEAPEDQEICLENVLALDPDHAAARQALADIRRVREAATLCEPPFAEDTGLPDSLFVPVEQTPPPAETTDYRSPIELNAPKSPRRRCFPTS